MCGPSIHSRYVQAIARKAAGFTLIELMVTISVLAILLSLAVPSFIDFMRAARGGSLSSAFVGDMTRARSEAITNNSCAKMCQSANVANALSGGVPTCATSGDEWERGWILFLLPNCDTDQNNPTASGAKLLSVHMDEQPDFSLISASAVRRSFVFDPRGVLIAGNNANLALSPVSDGASSKHARSICVSWAGRVTVRAYGGVDGCTD
jgi:type IV fimbrial biogenesis protein FimT